MSRRDVLQFISQHDGNTSAGKSRRDPLLADGERGALVGPRGDIAGTMSLPEGTRLRRPG
jgi:hypothetical protein